MKKHIRPGKQSLPEKQILLFGFDDLGEIRNIETAAEGFGANIIPVSRGNCSQTLGALCGLEKYRESVSANEIPVGRMMVLCALDTQLDGILQAFSNAGCARNCLKAVLTVHNRSWTPVRLYSELRREEASFRGTS